MTVISPPRHIAWTIPPTGLISPIRSRTEGYIRQIIERGKAEDVVELHPNEGARPSEEVNLPPYLHSLWARLLEPRMLRGKSLLLLSCTPSHRSERRPGA